MYRGILQSCRLVCSYRYLLFMHNCKKSKVSFVILFQKKCDKRQTTAWAALAQKKRKKNTQNAVMFPASTPCCISPAYPSTAVVVELRARKSEFADSRPTACLPASLPAWLCSIFRRPYMKVSQANYQALSAALASAAASVQSWIVLTFILGYCNWKCNPKDVHTHTHRLHTHTHSRCSSPGK